MYCLINFVYKFSELAIGASSRALLPGIIGHVYILAVRATTEADTNNIQCRGGLIPRPIPIFSARATLKAGNGPGDEADAATQKIVGNIFLT